MKRHQLEETVVCIVGLGYVGLPLAQAFSQSLRVIGFDTDTNRVNQLREQHSASSDKPSTSTTDSVGLAQLSDNLFLTTNPEEISKADFIIICVPTPVTTCKEPDLSHVKSAAAIVSQNMKKDSIVILESTVYPGVTEEVVKPILEEVSNLKCGNDFKIAYSPERINPGDKEYTLARITKVVAGIDEEATDLVAELYRKVTPNIFKAKDIRTAEAAKVIENIQRDLNIALMNELSLIFDKMGLSTKDVLDAAATKWNFQRYSPGLVGGHCIPVDPYYLVYKARELGYHSQVIMAGRGINDYMPRHVAEMTIKALNDVGKVIKGSRVLIMGLTFKENVSDIRETPVLPLIKELTEYGVKIWGFDPLVGDIAGEIGIQAVQSIKDSEGVDCVILTVDHSVFSSIRLDDLKKIMSSPPILIDVRGIFSKDEAEKKGFYYRTL